MVDLQAPLQLNLMTQSCLREGNMLLTHFNGTFMLIYKFLSLKLLCSDFSLTNLQTHPGKRNK